LTDGEGRTKDVSEIAERYRRIAQQFTDRVESVPAGAWDNPAPCEGWLARDVVRHLVEWVPGFFGGTLDLPEPGSPSVDDDPVGAWSALDAALRSALDDPEASSREFEMQAGRFTVENAVDTFCTPDVLMHTWDLARATGLDETLDITEVRRALAGLQSVDEELLRGSGQFGPRVEVADDADDQTKLIAYSGRHP
jgi:uncharacterized protein (TIGR03086 family)